MNRRERLRRRLADGFERLGWEGGTGVVLIAAAIAAYAALLRPELHRVDALKADLARLGSRAPARVAGAAATPYTQMADFYKLFPSASRPSQVLDKIVAAAAAQGLGLEQGEYRFVRDAGGELLQFQISLPVKGSYVQVRKFIAAALAAVPALALEGVQMERQKIGDSVVEARIRMLAFMREDR